MPVPTVLLVGPDAAQWAGRVPSDAAEVTAAPTAAEARAYLGGTAYDAVFVQDAADAAALRALRDVLGLAAPVEAAASVDDVLGWLGRARDGASPGGGSEDWRAELRALRDDLGRVAHTVNNPLAVIAGNAQLGIELAAALGTDESVVEALQNIAEAASDLADLFGEIAALRARVDRAVNAR